MKTLSPNLMTPQLLADAALRYDPPRLTPVGEWDKLTLVITVPVGPGLGFKRHRTSEDA